MASLKWSLVTLDEVSSTQDEAAKLAEAGADEGTVVMAATQTEGRGRTGRSWLSPTGGLYFSLLVRPKSVNRLQLLPLVASFSVVDGVRDSTAVKSSVRWPNDVVVHGKKASGVICESSFKGGKPKYSLVGIGVNCNSSIKSLGRLSRRVTTLAMECGHEVDVSAVLRATLTSFQGLYSKWESGEDVIASRKSDISTIGQRVELRKKDGKTVRRMVLDVTSEGELAVKQTRKSMYVRAEDVDLVTELGS
ncbi:MAG TPA: biotin--[acetyl-CoA-carboxylase] ligase [Nitrososphaerales archaeon]|nr:biotin--[acetyl-CoA-carboxylase] ligase [Nitrososphaerales archaeon]